MTATWAELQALLRAAVDDPVARMAYADALEEWGGAWARHARLIRPLAVSGTLRWEEAERESPNLYGGFVRHDLRMAATPLPGLRVQVTHEPRELDRMEWVQVGHGQYATQRVPGWQRRQPWAWSVGGSGRRQGRAANRNNALRRAIRELLTHRGGRRGHGCLCWQVE